MIDPLLSMDEVYAGYGETSVLHGVNLDIKRSSVVTLVGRNGAGKTTTLRSIIGNITPTGGIITYKGEDITTQSSEETVRGGIAFVPEDRRIWPGLTVRENIEMGKIGSLSKTSQSVESVLSMFEKLRQRKESRGSVLSGGEQQMLAIARALIADPDLLILDEPTEGLAPYVIQQIEEVIAELHDSGITILLVEQNISIALDVSEYAYVLEKGRIVHKGVSNDIKANEELLDRYLGVGALD